MSTATEKAQHTPGPWEACHDMDGDFVVFAGKKIIAITDKDSDEEAANASLMSSAPEMLEALERCKEIADGRLKLGSDPYFSDIFFAADSAIKRARGEQ